MLALIGFCPRFFFNLLKSKVEVYILIRTLVPDDDDDGGDYCFQCTSCTFLLEFAYYCPIEETGKENEVEFKNFCKDL